MKRILLVVLLLLCCSSVPVPAADWSGWQFLLGEWAAEGPPEQGSGGFTLTADLDDQVLVRHSHADYPPSDTHHTTHHRDLMIISPHGADYWDNEGHVIHYTVSTAADNVVLTSPVSPDAPQFRLTYTRLDDTTVDVRFEVAPPGKPFSVYIESKARRVKQATSHP